MSHLSSQPRHTAPAVNGLSRRQDHVHLDYDDEAEDDLVLPADSLHGSDVLEERVQSTQNRLARLRAEAEALEREKEQFEVLSRKQREFMHGRVELTEKLSRAITQIDRETYEAQKRAEQLMSVKDSFEHHLEIVDSLNPEQWNPDDLSEELTESLELIHKAREEYVRGSSKVASLAPVSAPAPAAAAEDSGDDELRMPRESALAAPMPGFGGQMNKDTFRFWVFCGLGFTLPVALIAMVLFVVWLIAR